MKQVIVVDASLGLPTGKLAAQVAHAAVGALLHADRKAQAAWFEAGMPKIVLQCSSPEALLAIAAEAEAADLPSLVVRDAGRTVVQAGTATCVGIGPAPAAEIDRITGALPLLP
ncbi:MAG TPA: peptidyl-tRNA hydrolase Pth2 [Caulobacteraceae bacterium]|nr:peptidyl-tRNA hydrolase Pth2 [Caulobacteraceae bacterium]